MANQPGDLVTHTVLIADDEPLARERIRTLLSNHDRYRIIAECSDGTDALNAIVSGAPDVAFLDISMPGIDGFDLATALASRSRRPAIVFVTAFGQHAIRAFDVGAIDYLMKPFDATRLAAAIHRVDRWLEGPGESGTHTVLPISEPRYPDRFVVRGVRHLYFVPVADIEWVDAASNYVRLHCATRAHLLRATMTAFADRLHPERFVRIHRSTIVRIDQVAKVRPLDRGEYSVVLKNGTRLRASQRYGSAVREILGR